MYTKEEILDMLQNGQEAEELAQGFIDALNAAIKQKEELDKAAAIAEKEKKLIRQEKEEIVAGILDVIFGYIEEYYPKVYSEGIYEQLTAPDVVDAMDEAYEEICNFTNALDDFAKILEIKPEEKNVKCKPKEAKKPIKTEDFTNISDILDPIEKFLADYDLI